jgi:hypothetical protein
MLPVAPPMVIEFACTFPLADTVLAAVTLLADKLPVVLRP